MSTVKKQLIASAIIIIAFLEYINLLIPGESLWLAWLDLAMAALQNEGVQFILALVIGVPTAAYIGMRLDNFISGKK